MISQVGMGANKPLTKKEREQGFVTYTIYFPGEGIDRHVAVDYFNVPIRTRDTSLSDDVNLSLAEDLIQYYAAETHSRKLYRFIFNHAERTARGYVVPRR